MRWRTSFFCTARYAAEISFSRPSKLALAGQVGLEDLVLDSSSGLALLLAGDREQRRSLSEAAASTAAYASAGSPGRPGTPGLFAGERAGELGLRLAQGRDERLLGGLEALGDDLLGRAVLPSFLTRSTVASVASASTIMIATSSPTTPAGDDHVEGRALDVAEVREGDPVAVDEDTRTPPIGPLKGRPEIWVDGDAALMASTSYWWSGFRRQHRDDDLDLVAQALDEGRAQRPVDQPAGEDRVGGLGRPSRRKKLPGILPAAYIRSSTSTVSGKKSNWSLGVLAPAVVVDRAWCRRRGRRRHGACRLLGQTAGLEPDGAGAELPLSMTASAKCDLHLGAAGIALNGGVLSDDLLLGGSVHG
jgi:hypothetical protein